MNWPKSQQLLDENSKFIPGGLASLNRKADPVIAFARAKGSKLFPAGNAAKQNLKSSVSTRRRITSITFANLREPQNIAHSAPISTEASAPNKHRVISIRLQMFTTSKKFSLDEVTAAATSTGYFLAIGCAFSPTRFLYENLSPLSQR